MKRPAVKPKRHAAVNRAADQQMEKELARLASFPERNPNPVVEVDIAGRVHYLNPAARQLLPGLEQRGSEHPWLADWPEMVCALSKGKSKAIVREIAVGKRFYHQTVSYVKENERIRIYGMDITELKDLERREKQRAASHIAARTAMDTIGAMPIGMALIRMSGSIASVNSAFESMTGYKHDEVSGNDARDVIGRISAAGDRVRILALLQDAEQGKPADTMAATLKAKTGAIVPVIIDVSFIKDSQGRPASIVMSFKDITDLCLTEDRLRKNEARLSEAQRIAHLGNWDWNVVTGELVWSDEIYRIFGLQPQEFGATYDAFLQSVHPEDRDRVREAVQKALRHESPYDIDHRIVLPDGAERMVHERGEVFKDKTGRPIRMAGTVQDITEHKKAERRDRMITTLLALFARKSSRKEYLDAVIRVFHQESGCRCVGIRIVDEKGRIPYESSIGFPPRFIQTESALVIGKDSCICGRVIAGTPELQDLSCMTPAGSFRCENIVAFMDRLSLRDQERFRGQCVKCGFASMAVVPISYHGHIYGAIHLADERAGKIPREQTDFIESIMAPMLGEAIRWFAMDQSLRQAGAYNRSLIEASLDPLVTIDAEGKITDVNAATEKITGRSRTELIGTDFADYFTDFEKAQSGYQQVFRDGWVQDYALEIRRRDGRVTPVLYNASVYRDQQGKIVGVFAAARDISERKRAEKAIESYQHELRSLFSRLALAEESARRQLAIALHDTVSQTQAVAQIKLDALGEMLTGRKARQAWTEIRRMLEDAVQQTRTLNFELSPPILYELGLDPALEWLGEEFQQRHGFQFHFDCFGDKSAVAESLLVFIFQSVRELLTNVVKHAGAKHVYVSSRIADGRIVVSVKDDGKGFASDTPLPPAKKNSLGLFSIRERMQYSGGVCQVVSAPGKGAMITLSVPVELKTSAGRGAKPSARRRRKRKINGKGTKHHGD